MDISNRSLALVLVASIVISTGGTFLALTKLDQLRENRILTGYATTSGDNLTITITGSDADSDPEAKDHESPKNHNTTLSLLTSIICTNRFR